MDKSLYLLVNWSNITINIISMTEVANSILVVFTIIGLIMLPILVVFLFIYYIIIRYKFKYLIMDGGNGSYHPYRFYYLRNKNRLLKLSSGSTDFSSAIKIIEEDSGHTNPKVTIIRL